MDPNLENLNAPTLAFHRWTALRTVSATRLSECGQGARSPLAPGWMAHRVAKSTPKPARRFARSGRDRAPRGSRPDDSQFVGRNGSIISGFERNSWDYAAVWTREDA